MKTNRKQVVETFIKIIEHISDKDYQKRVWIKGKGPEVDDFDETVNFFTEIGDPILKNHQDYKITENHPLPALFL